jgi:hypothetical protein
MSVVGFGCRVQLWDGGCLLLVFGSRLVTVDYWVSVLLAVVGSWLSGVGCRLLVVHCWYCCRLLFTMLVTFL